MQQLHPSNWKAAKGYANGIAAEGTVITLGGQIGWNAQQEFESDDFIDQARQCLENIVAVLAEADAGPEHLVRMTWFILDKQEYLSRLKDLGAVYRDTIGRNFPAMTMVVVSALIEDRARLEIEATAVRPSSTR